MYVVKVDRYKMFWYAKVFEKRWSEELFSNKITLVCEKKFLIKWSAKKWYKKRIISLLTQQKELEIQNG